MKKINYQGWELEHFDNSSNFRLYQYDLIKDYLTGYAAEVGPGNGECLEIYRDKFSKIDLYEPSKPLFKKLELKFKNYKNIFFRNEIFKKKENTYNTIIYLDVLEHIKHDKLEIENAFHSLKPGGKLVLNVPAFQHLFSNFDKDVNHYRRYNKKEIFSLVQDLNYSYCVMKYYDSIGYILSILSKLFSNDYKKNFSNKIKIWNFLIPVSRILDKLLFNLFGKSLLIIIFK